MRGFLVAGVAAALFALGGLTQSQGARAERALTSTADLEEVFSGSVVAGDGPAGRPFKLFIYNSGKVMLEAGGNPEDSGAWSVQDGSLCVQFKEVFQARETCFQVIYWNPKQVLLVQNESISIEASIVDRAIELSVR